MSCDPVGGGRWPVWRLALLLFPFAAAAVAINIFMLGLVLPVVALPSLTPTAALVLGVLLGIPAAWWCGHRLRSLMDEADSR